MTQKISQTTRLNIGRRLKAIRALFGMQQTDFSDLVGISQSTCSDLERGKIDIQIGIAIKLAEKRNVSETWLLSGQGPMMKQEGCKDA